jgi:AraC-like DNA-binding protein
MFKGASSEIQFLVPDDIFPRHRHDFAYAAVVLAGRYLEAGDAGRRWVQSGDVILHREFEAHADTIPRSGATILNLRLEVCPRETGFASVSDVDEIVRCCERDPRMAADMIVLRAARADCQLLDWPDQLAHELRGDGTFSLEEWALCRGLAPSTVSRSFRRAFGVSPKRYRLEVRTQAVLGKLSATRETLARIAADAGFSDQSHMARSVRAVTGRSPRSWRA